MVKNPTGGLALALIVALATAAFAASVFLMGCGYTPPPGAHANHQVPRDQTTTPRVLLVGDDVIAGLSSPIWYDEGVPGQTSTQLLDLLPTELADYAPDVVVIATGATDMMTYWQECGYPDASGPALARPLDATPPPAINTCANVEAMIALATAAGAKVILCNVPPYGPPDPDGSGHYVAIAEYNGWLTTPFAPPGVTVLDIHSTLTLGAPVDGEYAPGYTDNGLILNQTGYAALEPALYAAVEAQGVGGQK